MTHAILTLLFCTITLERPPGDTAKIALHSPQKTEFRKVVKPKPADLKQGHVTHPLFIFR